MCAREELSLSDLRPGDTAEVVSIRKGRRAQMRLLELGITPGSRVTIVAVHPLRGPVVVRVGTVEAALGWGLASSVRVRRLSQGTGIRAPGKLPEK